MKKSITVYIFSFLLMMLVLLLYLQKAGIEPFELKFYDFAMSWRNTVESKNIYLISIDDESILKIGRWPWERNKIAELINILNEDNSRPSVIGLNILFSEKENEKYQNTIDAIDKYYRDLLSKKAIKETNKESSFLNFLNEIKKENDNDLKLSIVLSSASNVALPMFFNIDTINSKIKPEPEYFKNNSITISQKIRNANFTESSSYILPIDTFSEKVKYIGHVNVFSDMDGSIRRHKPFISYNDNLYISFPLAIACIYNSIKPSDIILDDSKFIFSKKEIFLNEENDFYISYLNTKKAFKNFSFYDVINKKIPAEIFKDKIVIIGLSAHGLGSFYVTPVDNNMSNIDYMANAVENILDSNYIKIPNNAKNIEVFSIILIGLFSIIALPRLKSLYSVIISIALLFLMLGFSFYNLTEKSQWYRMTYPSFLLVISYLLIMTKKFFFTEKKKELVEMSAIETNKLLGLSFQGQGMLDMAFEKFRQCPLDEPMKELMYNLALDFERKRQFNKAQVVYEYIFDKDKNYKDVANKIEVMKSASQGNLTALGQKSKDSTILVNSQTALPTLGRYEVMKELGKGAMGIVYLGKDPKINREVAIKTMRFEEGMDEKEFKALKERFFKEAQAAGTLSHPNIIKIYDAGEDGEIAYMAMELLKGKELKEFTSKDKLLPPGKVLEIIYHVASALNYAHKNGIIHRDIKPANIMMLEDGTIRVTDFGIARIQESSKTATGTVMGTPYYMSPEQISGKKVDGRADIFSLGVTMYELLTGERPWKGGDSIATLFYQITNETFEKPSAINKALSEDIDYIVEKALKKNPDERYQNAEELANDIKAVLEGKKILKNEKKAEEPKKEPIKDEKKEIKTNIVKDSIQSPISETFHETQKSNLQKVDSKDNLKDVEKTLPLIYPDEDGGKSEK